MFIGSLAADLIKIGVASAITWGAGSLAAITPFIAGPLVVVISVGFGVALLLNYLDSKFGATDKIISYIDSAQQEFVMEARKTAEGIWDLGAMQAEEKLVKGLKIIKSEIVGYLKESINSVTIRIN